MLEDIKREYFDLLRFESVGADPAKLKECVSCALWLKKWLDAIGFEGELLMNEIKNGKAEPPVLYAEKIGSEGAPTVLIYGHYDVQPSDPLSEWLTPPFEPTEKDGRIYCRGAQDDKGQFFAFLNGIKDYLATNPSIVPTIKIILEGQEESGSEALIAMAESMRKRIAADVLLVCDTSAASDLRPAIVAGLRGVSHFTIRLKGPSRDLHSGSYGGIAPNPAQAIAEIVSSLHNPDGSIAVEGFYNGIERPTSEEIAAAEAGGDTKETYEADIGCEAVGGEEGKSIIERNSFEPTIEVNGIHSGYSGPGSKTVIPSEAFAKISMRLVPGQSTRAVRDAVTEHLKAHCPRGMTLSIEDYTLGAGGFRLPLASPLFRLASDVLSEMDNRGAVYQWDGASIPVISVLKEISGAAPLIVGWGQAEDKIHSPNESYSLAQFEKAREWGRKIIAAF